VKSLEGEAVFSVELIMYFAVGFLAASLSALAIFPAVLNRAVRLNTRRIVSAMPYSLTEVMAEKDSLRAIFAVEIRKLETRIEQLVSQRAMQAVQLGRQHDAIKRLNQELEQKAKLIAVLEACEDLVLRKDASVDELLAPRDKNQKNRETGPVRLPSAHWPWRWAN
jgi:hypothetical protein